MEAELKPLDESVSALIDTNHLPEIVVYQHIDYGGWNFRTNLNVIYIGDSMNDQISSFIVVSGRWQFFRYRDFADPTKMELLPEHGKLSAYYNLDNGTGAVRGIYLQGNAGAKDIFQAWLNPFADLGAKTVTISNTGGTDHQAYDAVGLPGFQFIQDPMDYNTRTHHTNQDTYDRLVEDDLKKSATIIASFVYHTSERAEKIPRKELPKPVAPRN